MADFRPIRILAFSSMLFAALTMYPPAAAARPGLVPHPLPVDDEITLGKFHLRILRILENDPEKDFDDSVVVAVSEGERKGELTLPELGIAAYGNYEIRVFNVVPSRVSPGGGTAKIQVRASTRRDAVSSPPL